MSTDCGNWYIKGNKGRYLVVDLDGEKYLSTYSTLEEAQGHCGPEMSTARLTSQLLDTLAHTDCAGIHINGMFCNFKKDEVSQ